MIEDIDLTRIDYIITVYDHAHESCPVISLSCKAVHKIFEDPPKLAERCTAEEEILHCYPRVRDIIKVYIETLPGLPAEKGD